jgi:glycine/D-amino acid oxidase-like deaminating enzyme
MSDCEVLVVGGGMAGCAAALAAVRDGARVTLLERHSYLGGNATRALVAPWQSFHAAVRQPDGSLPAQVIGGIAQEIVDDLVRLGGSLGHVVDPLGFAGSLTPVDSEVLKQYLPRKLAEAGVDLRLGTAVSEDDVDAAVQVVDASGTAAAARMMGAGVIEPTEPQPLSWLFTMTGVDTREIRDHQLAHREQFVLHPAIASLRTDFIAVSGFFDLVSHARASGELNLPRDRLLFFSTPNAGEVLVNTTRVPATHPQPREEGMRQLRELADWLPRRVPGFSRARLGIIADDIGQRESWRLAGRQTLSVDDIVNGRGQDHAVARGCYPIDIHRAGSDELLTRNVGGGGYYDIALGCLESANVARLLTAGRCISADRQGFASARVIPTAMATGQAAGMIAAHRALGKEISTLACLSHVSLV